MLGRFELQSRSVDALNATASSPGTTEIRVALDAVGERNPMVFRHIEIPSDSQEQWVSTMALDRPTTIINALANQNHLPDTPPIDRSCTNRNSNAQTNARTNVHTRIHRVDNTTPGSVRNGQRC